ncbi:hypothetical protein L228DRAFT_244402 [Xylona heveae TC161]|uniref:Uncharacterized protein n=1 Tax=Xylona heveae (strain CBS 132557 / TC161) TaxID=1328760 RepID=A0A165IYD6_XYLHT|nr:hypothetical protein L228DRAFT_244402 [Xylona heveae TC161]KZF25546.1 hypothetical protein L228DRAFT_244402 [Xylona heveae TC161]
MPRLLIRRAVKASYISTPSPVRPHLGAPLRQLDKSFCDCGDTPTRTHPVKFQDFARELLTALALSLLVHIGSD